MVYNGEVSLADIEKSNERMDRLKSSLWFVKDFL
jgi:hypothetical protein